MGRINKISNKAKNRIASLLFIVIAVILLANSWVVKAAENVIRKTDDHSGDYKIPGYITYEQYANDPYLLCTARGVSIPGYSKTMVVSGEHKTHTTDQGKDTGYLTVNDLGVTTCFANDNFTDLVSTESRTYGYYTEAIVHDATPAETYVLAELEENTPGNGVEYEVTDQLYEHQDDVNEEAYIEVDGEKYYIVEYDEAMQATAFVAKKEDGKYYVVNAPTDGEGQGGNSYVQIAWWAVATVQEKGRAEDNSLAKEAREFENYINQLSEGGKYSIINENGEKQTEVTSISLNKTSLKMSVGDTEQLKVTMQPSNLETQDIVWKTSNKSIAMIDADGNVAAKAAGKATISVYLKNNEQMISNCIVTVKDPNEEEPENDTKVTELYVNKGEIVIETGKTATFTITMKPSKAINKKCTINIENNNIVTFDKEDGTTKVTLKGLKEGTTTVTVTLDDDQNIKDTIKVTVKDTLTDEDKKLSVHRVDLDKEEITLKVGDSSKLTATVLPNEAEVRNYSYKSSDDTIATVDDNGNVKGVKEGTATITVTTEDGNKTDTCKVNVKTTLDDEDPYTVDGKYESPVVGGNRFDIEYPVEMESENAEVLYDATTNTYKIGPFSTKYLRYITKQGDREAADFSGITKSTLTGKFYRDGEEVTEEIPFENYRFVYEHDHAAVREANNQVDTDESYPYPYSEEEFFIELNYMEDLASISGFRFDFHYWNGGGTFTVFRGNYLVITWQVINTGIAPGASSSAYKMNSDGVMASLSKDIKLQKIKNEEEVQLEENTEIKEITELTDGTYEITYADDTTETVTSINGPLYQESDTEQENPYYEVILSDGTKKNVAGKSVSSNIEIERKGEKTVTLTSANISLGSIIDTDTTNGLREGKGRITGTSDATTNDGRGKVNASDINISDVSVNVNGDKVDVSCYITGRTGGWSITNQTISGSKNRVKDRIYVKNQSITLDLYHNGTANAKVTIYFEYVNTLEDYVDDGNLKIHALKNNVGLELLDGNNPAVNIYKLGFLSATEELIKAELGVEEKIKITDGSRNTKKITIPLCSQDWIVRLPFEEYTGCKGVISTYVDVPAFHLENNTIDAKSGQTSNVIFYNACSTGYSKIGIRGKDGALNLPETLEAIMEQSGIDLSSLGDIQVDETTATTFTIDGYAILSSLGWTYDTDGEIAGFSITPPHIIAGLKGQVVVEILDNHDHPAMLTVNYESTATATTEQNTDIEEPGPDILVPTDVTPAPSQSQTTPGGEDPGEDPEPGEEDTEAGTGAVNLFDNETYIDFLEDGFEIDLTTDLSGMVWDDDEEGDTSKGEDMFANGVYNSEEGDVKLSKIEVIIWKVTYEKSGDGKYVETDRVYADAYRNKTIDENGSVTLENLIKFDSDNIEDRLFTDESGDYKAFVNVPAIEELDTEKYKVSYDVEFIYDGQTYETTEYLASTGETETGKKVEVFMSTSSTDNAVVDYSKYAEDSYAIETYEERKEFDSKFTEIYGESSIDTEGKTTGEASKTTPDGSDEDKTTLHYVSDDQGFDEETENAEGETDENTADNEETRKVSELVTTDDGYVRDEFKMKARTSTAGLLLPYEDRVHLEEKQEDIELDYIDTGVEGSYTYYKPITEYFSHINLGLVRRNDVDLTVMQDLYKAGVTVNQGELTYKYSTLVDLEHSNYANKLNMLLDVQNAGVNYEIGLYASDFYYRSDVYTADKQTEITKKIAGAKADSELRLFAGYRISVYNDSRDHDVSINELADYYDSTYTLVKDDIKTDLTDANGNIQEGQVVAESSYYRIYTPIASDLGETPYNYNRDEDTSIDGDLVRVNRTDAEKENMISGNVEWKLVEDFEATLTPIEGTEGGSYKKMVTESFTSRSEDGTEHTANELTLRPGEKLEIFVTFEVDHDGYDKASVESQSNVESDEIDVTSDEERDKENGQRKDLLGNKNNVVEVANYTTYYTEKSLDKNNNVAYKAGDVSGRVDKDSAADNINFSMTEKVTVGGKDYTVLDKSWFEDDTESAPVFRVYLRDVEAGDRELNGVVWEDDLTKSVEGVDYTKTGNGIYDEGETTIPGATVTLVEKIKIDGTEYEYVWQDKAFGELIPDYTSVTMSDANGLYTLNNFVSGNYVVRFEYGNTAMTMDYNGQDYKNTSYQEGIKNPTEEALINAYTDSTEVDQNNNPLVHTELMNNDQWDTEAETVNQELKEQITLNNEWHDLTGLTEGLTNSEDEKRVSDARDYEARRLDVIDYSRTIDNSVAEIFAIADSTTLQNLKAKLAEKMYGETPMTYGEALDAIKAEDAELKAFVESDEYRALIAFTAMEANTAKLNVLIENSAEVDFGKTKKSTDGAFQVNVGGSYDQIKDAMTNSASGEEYTIANIDFGLERRADTIIQTDKYMTEIELMKENERVFFIEINEDGTIKTTENTLAAEKVLTVLESQGVQGFKYINVEEDFLKNSTLNISYNVRVTNKSEVDYASEELVTKSYTTTQLDNHINTLLADAVTGEDMKYGKYVGLYYYTHDNSAVGTAKTVAGQEYKDAVVKTTVDQMVDYVDTNIELAETSKTLVENNAWNLAEIQSGDTYGEKFESLKGLISDDSYTKEDGEEPKEYLQNDKGDLYISESRSKVAISSNSNIKETTKSEYVLSRGEKGQGQLTYTIDPNDMKADNIGHKKYEQNQQVTVENIYVYKDNLGTAYNADVHNKELTKELYSINYKEDTDAARTATIKVQTSQDVGSTVDMEHMLYNNIAEVLVYSNAVGRRSMSAIPGNAIEIVKVEPDSMDTAKGGGSWNAGHSSNEHKDASIVANRDSDATQLTFQGTMLYAIATKEALANNTDSTIYIAELDTDAADYVTFTEPTGLSYAIQQQNMFIIIMLVALVVLAAGIILITVKVVMTKSTDDITIESTKE